MILTPKEQADKLIKEMFQPIFDIDNGVNVIQDKARYNAAIHCALIAVDKIINASPSLPILSESGNLYSDIQESKSYWQEVKNELLKTNKANTKS